MSPASIARLLAAHPALVAGHRIQHRLALYVDTAREVALCERVMAEHEAAREPRARCGCDEGEEHCDLCRDAEHLADARARLDSARLFLAHAFEDDWREREAVANWERSGDRSPTADERRAGLHLVF